MKTFFRDRQNHEPAEPARKSRKAEKDLTFDRELKRRILGNEPMEALAEEAEPTDTVPSTPAPAAQSSALQFYDAWEGLQPLGWRFGELAQASMPQDGDVKSATDVLRTQILQKMRAEGWTRLAITAPTTGCGATFITLNLALSLSAVRDARTVLLDLNQRAPGIAPALGLRNAPPISLMLDGKLSAPEYLRRAEPNLAVGLNGGTPENPAETLQSRSAAMALDEIGYTLAPDVVLCDVPPMLEYDDMTAFLPLVDCVLLVADGTKTLSAQVDACAQMLDGKAPLLGVVLNRGRVPRR
ncbi:MAG: CpsD/CapB family tyrosine-protein kinase [Roseovarius sp.]